MSSNKYPRTLEFKIIRENDKSEISVSLTQDKIGIFIVNLLKDITEDKKNEEIRELLEIHSRNTNKAITIINLDTKQYEYINEHREHIYGRKSEEFFNNSTDFWIEKCVHLDDKAYVQNIIQKGSDVREKTSVMELRIVRPDGEIRWLRKETTFIKFRNHNCAMHIETDITEEKKKDEVKDLLTLYAAVLNKALTIVDLETKKYVYINDAVKEMYGEYVEKGHETGFDYWYNECIYPPDRKLLKNCFNNEAEFFKKTPHLKYRIKRLDDGRIVYINSEATIINFRGRKCGIWIEEEISKEEFNRPMTNTFSLEHRLHRHGNK